ncbi:MAG: DUF3426 domain-containing protein [Gammaproteobacteria bacterium]|nr:DUF3426 domain-containing protein [Gammaproteobacteria bacterium]
MHTRCTHCDTAFRITPEVLTYARGRVRCGQCLRTFDALEHLSEEAGNVLVPVTPEARPDYPDLEETTPDLLGNEKNPFDATRASPESEYDGSEWKEAAQGILDVDEDRLTAEPASADTEAAVPGVQEAAFNVDQGTPEYREETFETRADPFAAEDAVSEVEEDMLTAVEASAETEGDAAKAQVAAVDVAYQVTQEYGEETVEAQPDALASQEKILEGWEVPLADEDDTLDGDLDLDATNSWKLDEELLNTSTLPALPGLVEHPEYTELQESMPEPVVTAKPRPEMNWDDSWDDMSFDDEHGIPLMEDLEEFAEIEDEAAVAKEPVAERIWPDPVTTLTEADAGEPVEPEEDARANLAQDLQEPTETDAEEPVENTWAPLVEDTRDPTERDVAELVEAIENAANMVTETGGASFASNLEIRNRANPEQNVNVSAARANRGPGDTNEPAPATDIAEVQAELERLAQLVGMEPGEIDVEAGGPQTAEKFEHIVRKRRSGRSMVVTGLFSLLLAIMLGAQLVHYNRNSLLADANWGPLLRQAYSSLGVDLPPDWELDRYDIRQLGGIQDPSRPGVLVISISVRNQASRAQPYPVIRLVLEDRWGDRLAMRDLKPVDYLDSDPGQDAMMLAGQMIKTDISIVEPEGAGATTFQVDACIENPRGHLDCANQL